MVFCHECNIDLSGNPTHCYLCGRELTVEGETEWVMIGTVKDKIYADFVKETLKSCGIEAVIISKSGFFGNVGLSLNPFYATEASSFEVFVPEDRRQDAVQTLDMTLGDKWTRKD